MFSFGKLFYTICFLTYKATKRDLPKLDFSKWFYVLVDCILSFGGGMSMIISLHVAIRSGINQGVITCLFALQSIFLAFIGKAMFNEAIKWYHYLGIGLMTLCAVFIGIGKSPPSVVVNGEEVPTISAHVAVLIALVTPFMFALRNIWVRVCKIKGDMCPGNLTIASSSIVSVILVILSFILLPLEEFGKEIFVRMLVASFFSIVALIFLSHAMAIGFAGPVSALANV